VLHILTTFTYHQHYAVVTGHHTNVRVEDHGHDFGRVEPGSMDDCRHFQNTER